MFYRTDVRYIPKDVLRLIERRQKILKEVAEIDNKLGKL
tara:strand:+ start:474 stop:590 length:117 start_codon:yes stop_codon:yes gene_type:complete